MFYGLHREIFPLGMCFVATSKPGVHFAMLAGTGSTNRTWNKEFLLGAQIALLHGITIARRASHGMFHFGQLGRLFEHINFAGWNEFIPGMRVSNR
jgi:hypothetical protein